MKKFLTLTLAIMIMALGLTACAAPSDSSGSKDKNVPKPADTTVYLRVVLPDANPVELAMAYDNRIYMYDSPTGYNLVIEGEELEGNLDYNWGATEIPVWSYAYTLSEGVSPLALNPGPSATYVGIFGYAIKQPGCTTFSPYESACIRDVSAYCPLGVCNIPLNVSKADWLDASLYYGGMVRPDNLEVVAGSVTTPLNTYINRKLNQSLPAGDPDQREWTTTCFFVDQAPTGIITVRTNNPICTLTPTDLWSIEIHITGNSAGNSLDDILIPYDGTTLHDGRILVRGTMIPDTQVPPAIDDFPQILFGTTGYDHNTLVWTPTMGGTLAVYSSSRSPIAMPGDIAPLLGGVFLRTRRLGNPTIVCSTELHYVVASGTVTMPSGTFNMLYFTFTGINTATGCIQQNATDNRLQALSGT